MQSCLLLDSNPASLESETTTAQTINDILPHELALRSLLLSSARG